MSFLREIPANRLTQEILDSLEAQGYTLKWMTDSIEVWADYQPYEEGQP